MLSRRKFYKIISRYPGTRRRLVVALLTAGFRSKEHPELWQHARQLSERSSSGADQSDGDVLSLVESGLFETQLSCSDAAGMLVDLMQLDKGPWESIELLPNRDALQADNSKVWPDIPNWPTPTVGDQIVQLLTLLTKSVRRLESELGIVKEEIKGVKEKMNLHGPGLDQNSIELTLPTLTLPTLPVRVKVHDLWWIQAFSPATQV